MEQTREFHDAGASHSIAKHLGNLYLIWICMKIDGHDLEILIQGAINLAFDEILDCGTVANQNIAEVICFEVLFNLVPLVYGNELHYCQAENRNDNDLKCHLKLGSRQIYAAS